ncbi:MAG: MFS transporter [Planctomycetia bacterium]|nr:MFS transporter [Planctomycetia bacterium]
MPHPTPPSNPFPLDSGRQLRNVVLYAACTGLIYLSAPVVYVGIVQASLCHELGTTDAVANLPSTAFYLATIAPLFVAWQFRTVGAIKPVVFACFVVSAVAGLAVAAPLWAAVSVPMRVAAVVAHGAVIGGATTVMGAFLWELVRRGIAPERRGLALGLAYGTGPLLAVAGSMGTQLLLAGQVALPWQAAGDGATRGALAVGRLQFPLNFALVFASTAPILGLAAILSRHFVLPPDTKPDDPRPPFWASLIEGVGDIVGDRVLLLAVIAYSCVIAGTCIVNNMALYTAELFGGAAEDYAGYQNALRFAFKVVCGLFLGWLLSRTHAKMGALVATGMCLAGILWALIVPKPWFLLSFGLMGAGDLCGVYFPNYVMTSSPVDKVRRNIAYLQLMTMPASFAPAAFGAISDAYGFKASFLAAAAMAGTSLAIVALRLPARR